MNGAGMEDATESCRLVDSKFTMFAPNDHDAAGPRSASRLSGELGLIKAKFWLPATGCTHFDLQCRCKPKCFPSRT